MAVSPTPEQWESVLDNTVQPSTNWSLDPWAEAPEEFDLGYWMNILILVIAQVGLGVNSLVLWLLGFRVQRSPFFVYIFNLAGADALFLGSFFGWYICQIIEDLSAYFACYLLNYYILYMSHCVGLSLLAAISTERCLSVLFPIWYKCHRPKQASAAVCAALWALPALFCGVLVALYFLENLDVFHAFAFALPFLEFGWFSLLTCVLCVSSLTLVLRVQCSSQRRRPPRLYLLILLTVLVFLLCGLPLGIIDSIVFFRGSPSKYYWLARLLACVNSSANPFIYFFLGSQRCRRGREPLRVILQRALEEEQERDTSHTNALDMSP
ncbi:mas-related G-protein coupled receptor member X1-like [Gracilinanus agilis]|uniref:mas-related G-protein coupled receptor member X1-like n=1 Tax=Gracilinanus agilis TaxID=191870 RepID=UPI001CFDC944|nr:mas-related G-protein coupled receptor member X1-like [Gracilinanus agilis]